MQDTIDPKRRYLCRHVHTDGRRCGSPALRGQNFCYYHDRQRLSHTRLAGRTGIFRMQPIDDRAAIQIAIFDVLSRITAGDIDNKRASILLYGLQIASSNLARQEKLQPATEPLEDVTSHQFLGDLAPIAELPASATTPSESVILSEAKDLSSSRATEPESTPPLPHCVIRSEQSESTDPRICVPTTAASAPIPSETVILSGAKDLSSSPATEPETTPENSSHELTLPAVEATACNPTLQTISTTRSRHPNQAVEPPSSRSVQAVSCRCRTECHQPKFKPRRCTVRRHPEGKTNGPDQLPW